MSTSIIEAPGADGPRVRDPSHWVFAKLFIGHEAEPASQRADRADDLLSRRFAPLFEQWDAQGLRSFFIRYHEDGYHLRLRVFAADDAPRQQARQQLVRLLRALRPAGTRWKLAVYAPELEKYGGPLGNYWAEQHFHASSALVLQLLQRLAALPVAERAAMRSQLAIVLMHATLAGAGLNEQDTSSLCSGYYRYWWRNASGDRRRSMRWSRCTSATRPCCCTASETGGPSPPRTAPGPGSIRRGGLWSPAGRRRSRRM